MKGPPGDDGDDGAPGTTNWSGITDKPSTFTPATHTHAASDVTSGTLDAARVPNLAASKITSGTLAEARIPAITSSMVADGTLVDADINGSAAIAVTKLGTGRVTGSNNGTATTLTLWRGTAAQYAAIGTKDSNTVYVVVD
ncbi:MAG: hypothetical protein EKK60_08710 [Gordonia sp. (in: high G+C Gram-positive bacteria)]|nr:MAG: hypothetical protein EKK60_08710 [Gordonia sp. (in: high G+C Gram-positive bacteria)]